MSCTATTAVHSLELPAASVAVKVTVVSPKGKRLWASFVTLGVGSQLSVVFCSAYDRKALRVLLLAEHPPDSEHSSEILLGQLIAGGTVSTESSMIPPGVVVGVRHVCEVTTPSLRAVTFKGPWALAGSGALRANVLSVYRIPE